MSSLSQTKSFTLPTGRDPTDDEICEVGDLLANIPEWSSDYDNGICLIDTNGEAHRAGPGQTITVDQQDGSFTITGVEIPYTG